MSAASATQSSGVLTSLDRIQSNFVVRRIAKAIFTVWLSTSIIFFIIRLMPGNPASILIEELVMQGKTEEEALAKAAQLMNLPLDKPLTTQYVSYLGNLLRGDLGTSYRSTGTKVSTIIAERLPWTLFSVGVSLFISFVLGMVLGSIAAYRRNTWIDYLISNVSAAFQAISPALVAVLLIVLLVDILKVLKFNTMRGAFTAGIPPGFNLPFISDIFSHLLIPGLVYVLTSVGAWILAMRSNTVQVLGEDYVNAARARGLKDSRILSAYVGRNASLPMFTRLAITIGFAVGGSILIEYVFTYRGIGLQLQTALAQRDYPVIQGIFMVTTIAVVLTNFLADFAYGWLDPRIRIAGSST